MVQPPIDPGYPAAYPAPYQPPPALPAAERVRAAYLRRHESDYIFEFWTAFGWTVLTCGYYLVYVVYQLMRRSRDHNIRRLELLEAANALAWERAVAAGLETELRPNFERVATHLEGLRRITREFRDPVIWLVLALLVRGIVELIAYVLLDGDLVKHDYDEGGAENELAFIYTRLGTPVDAPDPSRLHQPQNYVGRVLASVFTCGIYSFFWLYNVMDDGNRHFVTNWAWEDSLAGRAERRHRMTRTAEVDALLTRAQREIDAGLLPSCQIAIARGGELELFESYGDTTSETRYVVFSSTKAFVASAMWILIGEGLVDEQHLVAEYIPEFATNGKESITVEQVMLHTSGFPHAPLGPPKWWTRAGRVEQFGHWRLNWEPESTYEYHPTSAHWVLAEIIDRVTGDDYRDVIERRITKPIGLSFRVLGAPVDEQAGVAELVNVGEPATPDELEAVLGVRELPVNEVTPEALLEFNAADVRALGVPGGGGVMRAAELALFYQALLHDPAGIWDRDLLTDVTGRVRNTLPERWSGVTANRSLGLVVAGDDGRANLRGFGHTGSPRTFGHNGAGGQIAWADPDSGISFAYVTNGMDQHVIRQGRRGIALSSLAAVC